jgi:hypothetical protein
MADGEVTRASASAQERGQHDRCPDREWETATHRAQPSTSEDASPCHVRHSFSLGSRLSLRFDGSMGFLERFLQGLAAAAAFVPSFK